MVRTVFGVLGMVGVAIAQFNGPAFNPDTAPFFGVSNIVYPTTISAVPTLSNGVPTTVITPTFIRTLVSYTASSDASSVTRSASVSGAPSRSANSTMSRSLSLSMSRSVSLIMSSSSVEQSSSASSSSTSSASRTSASAPAQSSAAGIANVPGVVGAIAGGMFAGLALL